MSGLAVRNRSGGPVGSIACRLLADAGATVLVADAGLDAQVVILGPADELRASGPAVIACVTAYGTTGPLAARAQTRIAGGGGTGSRRRRPAGRPGQSTCECPTCP